MDELKKAEIAIELALSPQEREVGIKMKAAIESRLAASSQTSAVELAGNEPASYDLASEASPGAAGDLMSEPQRAPARSAVPILCEVPTRYSGACVQ